MAQIKDQATSPDENMMPSENTKKLDIARMKKSMVYIGGGDWESHSPLMEPYLHLIPPDCEPFKALHEPSAYYIIDLEKTWERMVKAARDIVAIENPGDIMVASDMYYGADEAVPRFVMHTGTRAFTGSYTKGTFTATRRKPRLIIITYPTTENHMLLMEEAFRAKIPIIALCDFECPMDYVYLDTFIPANSGSASVLCVFRLLSRMVLQMHGLVQQGHEWIELDPIYYINGYSLKECDGIWEEEVDCEEEAECKEGEEGDYTSSIPCRTGVKRIKLMPRYGKTDILRVDGIEDLVFRGDCQYFVLP